MHSHFVTALISLVFGVVGAALLQGTGGCVAAQTSAPCASNAKVEVHEVLRTKQLELVTEDGFVVGKLGAWGKRDSFTVELILGKFDELDPDRDESRPLNVNGLGLNFRVEYRKPKDDESVPYFTPSLLISDPARGSRAYLWPSGFGLVEKHPAGSYGNSFGVNSGSLSFSHWKDDPTQPDVAYPGHTESVWLGVGAPADEAAALRLRGTRDGPSAEIVVPVDAKKKAVIRTLDENGKTVAALPAE